MHTGAWMIRVVENGQSNWNDWTATYRLIWLYCHVVTEMIVLPRIEIYDCTVTWWDSCDWNDYAVTWRQKWLYCHLVTEMIVLPFGDWNDCTAIWWLKWLYFLVVTDRDSCCDNPVMEISWCMFQEFHRAGGQVPPITGVVTTPAKPRSQININFYIVLTALHWWADSNQIW